VNLAQALGFFTLQNFISKSFITDVSAQCQALLLISNSRLQDLLLHNKNEEANGKPKIQDHLHINRRSPPSGDRGLFASDSHFCITSRH
jgi:hypothetical protein